MVKHDPAALRAAFIGKTNRQEAIRKREMQELMQLRRSKELLEDMDQEPSNGSRLVHILRRIQQIRRKYNI